MARAPHQINIVRDYSMNLMKKITLVTDIAFWSNSYGSHMRIQNLVRFLAQHNDLTVFFLKSLPGNIRVQLNQVALGHVKMVSYKQYSGRKIPFEKRVSSRDFFKKFAAPDDFVSSLSAFLEENQSEAVILEYIRLAYLLDACPSSVTTILDMHDVMSARTISLRRAGLKAGIEISHAAERDLLNRFDRVMAISRADVSTLKSYVHDNKVIYTPHSVHVTARDGKPIGDGKRLLFVGANSAPNIEGLRWFLDQVWPMLIEDGYILDVVGHVGSSFPKVPDGVVKHGQQDDMSWFLRHADIAINPVFVGGGIKIKCIDTLAAGLPCITTVEGAAGLEGALGAGLVVANSRLEFLGAIRHFAASADARRVVARLAPRFIDNELGESAAYSPLQRFIETGSQAAAWA